MGVTYKLTSFGKAHQPLPGVKWEDLTAEEYEAALKRHPGMDEHGYFIRVEEEATPDPPATSRRAHSVPTPSIDKGLTEETDG